MQKRAGHIHEAFIKDARNMPKTRIGAGHAVSAQITSRAAPFKGAAGSYLAGGVWLCGFGEDVGVGAAAVKPVNDGGQVGQ